MSSLVLWSVLAFSAGPASASPSDQHDVVLLLNHKPLVLRLHLSLDGGSIRTARNKFIDRLIEELDVDGDGKLIRRETIRSPYLTTSGRPRGNTGFFDVFRNKQPVKRKEVESSINAMAGGAINYSDDRQDAQNDRRVFDFLDQDKSKSLSAKELQAAAKRLRQKDIDGDQCIILGELTVRTKNPTSLLNSGRRGRQTGRSSTAMLDAADAKLPRQLLDKYDADKDKSLSAAELGWQADRLAPLDANSDGKLNSEELKHLAKATPDVELAIRLGEREKSQPAVEVLSSLAPPQKPQNKQVAATFQFSDAHLKVLIRDIDPLTSSLDSALKTLERLDSNKNGYLEPEEADLRLPGGRLTFAAIDGNDDKKLLPEEMKLYVTLRAKPAATSCRVTLIDQGHGFFAALDKNQDGRISEREISQAAKLLADLERDNKDQIHPAEPVQTVSLEFSRGSFRFLGGGTPPRYAGLSAPGTSPAGPIWFQRMDRNRDGDVCWKEFLGERETFDRLDADQDGLIDPQEAADSH